MTQTTGADGRTISPHHLENLKASGISEKLAKANGIYSCNAPSELAKLHGVKKWNSTKHGDALVFPYQQCPGYAVLRPTKAGRGPKYLNPNGQPTQLYYPAGFHELESDSVIITEGCKKAICAQEYLGIPTIAVAGVYNWYGDGENCLAPDLLEAIKGRTVVVVFDSDRKHKPLVEDAARRLCESLFHSDCQVKLADIPGIEREKVGLDDLICKHGLPMAKRVIADATDVTIELLSEWEENPAYKQDTISAKNEFIRQHKHGGQVCLKLWNENYWMWAPEAGCYRMLNRKEFEALILKFLQGKRFKHLISKWRDIKSLIDADVLAWGTDASSTMNIWLDGRQGNFIALKNGILDIDQVIQGKVPELMPHSPDWFSPVCLDFDFNLDAECPTFMAMLDDMFDGDQEVIGLLQQFIGYCLLLKDRTLEKFLLLTGDGGTGKSTILFLIRLLVGSQNCSSVPFQKLGGSDRFSLFQTYGKAVNICPDMAELSKTNEADLKSFTSSSDYLTFEQKGVPGFHAKPTAVIVGATNKLPHFHDKSDGLWRRLIVIPCDKQISKRDPRYATADFWMPELPGIFIWAIQGIVSLKADGWAHSRACEDLQEQYRQDCDPTGEWLQDNLQLNEDCCVDPSELLQVYSEWARKNNLRPIGRNTLKESIAKIFRLPKDWLGYVKKMGGKPIRAIRGIEFIGSGPPDMNHRFHRGV